jgi:predicted permease
VGSLRAFLRGLHALVRRDAATRDEHDEVQHFLDETADAYERAGLSSDAARAAAVRDVGNVTALREHVRTAGWEHHVETLIGDIAYALRRLRQAPGFALTAVVTAALGIGASTVVFSAIKPVLLEPLPFPHASRLVTVSDLGASDDALPITLGGYAELRTRSHSFDASAVADAWKPAISGNGDPERLTGQRVTREYFTVFGAAPTVGRGFTTNDDAPSGPRVVILSDRLARRRFGGAQTVLGRTIDLDGDPYTVIGVMPAGFLNVIAPSADVWTPLRERPSGDFTTRMWGHHYTMIARLAPTATVESARRELLAIGRAPIAAFARPAWAAMARGELVRPMQDDVTGSVRPSLYAIVGAVLLLLVIASVNVTNLLIARGAQRRAEFAMRVALGAGRGRIVRQLLTESVVLALLGGALGFGVAAFGLQGLLAISPPGLPRADAIRMDARVFVFALALTTLVGLVVGLVPAIAATRSDTSTGLHHAARRQASGRRSSRNALVVAEVALAVVLLVSAGLLYRSVRRLIAISPGFDPAQVVTMQVVAAGHSVSSDAARLQFYNDALDAVRHVPGVTSAAFVSQLALSGDLDGYGYEVQSIPSSANGAGGSALRYAVTPDYVATMRIPLRAGRFIDASDRPGGTEAVVINESMAQRLFGRTNPIGQRLRFGPEMGGGRPWDYVVGVVGDVKQSSLAEPAPDAFYVATGQWNWVDNVQTLVVRAGGDAAALVPALKRAVWSVNANQPIQRERTMDSFVTASEGSRRFTLIVIETFAIVAFALAAVGLYGVVSGGVIERMREIGIRSALGASPGDIVGAVVRQSLLLSGSGSLIGVVAAVGATRLISSMLFGITRTDLLTYVGVAGLLVAMAVIAAWAPARRAAGIDPTTALRAE